MKKERALAVEETSNVRKPYIFRVYVTGASPNSSRAITNLRAFFEKYLSNRYELQIIDVYQQPMIAKTEQIVALPLLMKLFPLPVKRLIGNMSDTHKVKKGLDLHEINLVDD